MYPKLTQSKRYSDDETGFQNDLQQVRFNIINFFKIKIFFFTFKRIIFVSIVSYFGNRRSLSMK